MEFEEEEEEGEAGGGGEGEGEEGEEGARKKGKKGAAGAMGRKRGELGEAQRCVWCAMHFFTRLVLHCVCYMVCCVCNKGHDCCLLDAITQPPAHHPPVAYLLLTPPLSIHAPRSRPPPHGGRGSFYEGAWLQCATEIILSSAHHEVRTPP